MFVFPFCKQQSCTRKIFDDINSNIFVFYKSSSEKIRAFNKLSIRTNKMNLWKMFASTKCKIVGTIHRSYVHNTGTVFCGHKVRSTNLICLSKCCLRFVRSDVIQKWERRGIMSADKVASADIRYSYFCAFVRIAGNNIINSISESRRPFGDGVRNYGEFF